MSSLRPFVRGSLNKINAVRSGPKRSSHHGPPADYVPPSMNELPSPKGSWQAKNDADQKKYNMTLVAGLGVFSATIVGMKLGGLNFHYNPPETYE